MSGPHTSRREARGANAGTESPCQRETHTQGAGIKQEAETETKSERARRGGMKLKENAGTLSRSSCSSFARMLARVLRCCSSASSRSCAHRRDGAHRQGEARKDLQTDFWMRSKQH